LYPAIVNFTQAVRKCDSINGTVVLPKNQTEDDFIRNNYLMDTSVTRDIWLAIYDISGRENNVNYYSNKTLNYSNWEAGQPNNYYDYCAVFSKSINNKWFDRSCSDYYSLLCEITLSSKTNTNIMNIPFWYEWNSWSFCELFRHRINSNIANGTEYQTLNVSCSQICKLSTLN
jgi:hypothetical protein